MIVVPQATAPFTPDERKAVAQQRANRRDPGNSGSILEYLPMARDTLRRSSTQNGGLLEATLRAIATASSNQIRDVKRTDLNLKLLQAMARAVSVPLSLGLTGKAGELPVAVRTGGNAPKSARPDEAHFVVSFDVPKDGVEIPVLGNYMISYKVKSTGKAKVITAMYDLVQVLSSPAAQANGKPMASGEGTLFSIRVPLYQLSMAPLIAKLRLPATKLELYVVVSNATATSPPRFRLVQASLCTSLLGDAHELLATPDVTTDHNPAGIVPSAVQPKINPEASRAAEVIEAVLNRHLARTHGESSAAGRVCCTVIQGDQQISSVRGLEQIRTGETGDLLTALAVLRLVDSLPKDRPLEYYLRDETLLLTMLNNNGATAIAAALTMLYKQHGYSCPSVFDLLTHTAGLPDVASLDDMFDPDMLNKLLPVENPASAEIRKVLLARQLAERTILVAPPGSTVHPSNLGYSILRACLPNGSHQRLFLELGLDGTKLETTNNEEGAILSTCNDLARYLLCIEKSQRNPALYRLLPATVQAKYSLNVGLRPHDQHHITLGGWNICRVKLPVSETSKLSMVVLFKAGQSAFGASLTMWVPTLSLGVTCFLKGISMHKLFSKNQQEMSYGKRHEAKRFLVKHLMKDIIHAAVVSGVNSVQQQTDTKYSRETAHPPNYHSFVNQCRKMHAGPTGAWKLMFERSKHFQGEGTAFYPLVQSAQHIYNTESAGRSMDMLLQDLHPIQIKRVKVIVRVPGAGKRGGVSQRQEESYVLHDHATGHVFGMAFDPNTVLREGHAALQGHSVLLGQALHQGCFRLHNHAGHTLGEAVTVHLIPCGDTKVLCIKYRGRLYVTRDVLTECKQDYETICRKKHASRRHEMRVTEVKQFMPWKAASLDELAEDQEPVERIFGALFGGLLGLGLGASLFRPYPAYYGYYPYGHY